MTLEEASERIAAAFEAGIAPWSRSSRLFITCGLPVNAATSKRYGGVNTWLLELAAIDRMYRNKFWATRRQWQNLGGVVVRGEGTPVIDDGDREQSDGDRVLFNLEQVEVRRGAPVAALERFWVAPETFPDYDLARRLVHATGARVVPGERSICVVHADTSKDYIAMKPVDRYWGGDNYWWSVMFHELTHWVVLGYRRLRWRGEYSQGELIADIGATNLTNRCGIPMRDALRDQQEYAEDWINQIRENIGYLTLACAVAEVATGYVMNDGPWQVTA
jgi:antirestriction protein ArdC